MKPINLQERKIGTGIVRGNFGNYFEIRTNSQ